MAEKIKFIPKEKFCEIVAKIWADEDFKEAFIKDPNKALTAEGVELPEGMTVHVVKEWQPSTPTDYYFVLRDPNNPVNVEKSETRKAASSFKSSKDNPLSPASC